MKKLVTGLWVSIMVSILGGMTPSYAGDQTNTYFTANSALFSIGFKDRACGNIPTPFAMLDGEQNCAKVPNTYLYKLDKGDGKVTKEVRVLEGKWKSTRTTTAVTADGQPVTVTDVLDVVDGRSVFGSFGIRNNWNISPGAIASAFGGAQSQAEKARFFATGMASVRLSEGGSTYLGNSSGLITGGNVEDK